MKVEELFKIYNDCIMPTYTKTPLVFIKGKGSYLFDIHNRKYLDFFPGWGVGNLGHCHPKVMTAVRDQISKLIFVANNFYHIPQAKLAKELHFWVNFPSRVFFCNSGAEANEAAIKFSRKFGNGRFEIITFRNSFHGRTLGALAATGQDKYKEGFSPLPEGFKTVPFNNLQAVEDALTDKTVAIMLELIQGEGGINVATQDFAKGLRKICDDKKLLLIVDEVQTGIGRTGLMFAWQHYGITPDIITLAKSLAGGLPIGVMIVKKEISQTLGPGSHASTFGGGPVICKAALAVLKAIHKEKLLNKAKMAGEYLITGLSSLKERFPVISDIRGKGLMIGVQLKVEGKAVVECCMEKGLLINCTHDKVLRLMPALSVSKKEIDRALSILGEALEKTEPGA